MTEEVIRGMEDWWLMYFHLDFQYGASRKNKEHELIAFDELTKRGYVDGSTQSGLGWHKPKP